MTALVFIPGIMGCALTSKGDGLCQEDEEVWSEDVLVLLHALAKNPNVLSRPLIASRILRDIRVPGLGWWPVNLYGIALDNLQAICQRNSWCMQQFAYNWTQDNQASTLELVNLLRWLVANDVTDIVLVAHSMGGLICRLLLCEREYEDVSQKIRMVFQIGTPVLGSAKALYTLKVSPRFNWVLDAVVRTLKNQQTHYELMTALAGFPSLFQLLPPRSEEVLIDLYGRRLSAFDRCIWPPIYHGQLEAADGVQTRQSGVSDPRIRVVVGTGRFTSHGYQIDRDGRLGKELSPLVFGDGTVTVNSAMAGVETGNALILKEGVSHDELPNHQQVYQMIEQNVRSVLNRGTT